MSPEEPGMSPQVIKGQPQVDVTDLLSRVTRGNTAREALNELFNSDEWKQWNENPLTTWNSSLVDLPPQQRRKRIGPSLVKMIKDHYADNAAREFEVSGSQAADDWQAAQQLRLTPEDEVDTQFDRMNEALNAPVP